ncbi:kinase-like domain-containing protein [Glomus cerebriforme]|uniref:Kinase-like domain-containing protein n=1 Tax=Glomus cerebriforme TaxID=658196 RepID=A0A397SBT2_9GLOM|nr:kinase-like domain-containing protein [Glomus cerebriforme]
MEQKYLSDDVFEQIKDFKYWKLTEEQELLINNLILNEECYKCYGLCKKCKHPYTNSKKWCNPCITKHFQQNISATIHEKILVWIPYYRFYDIKYITKGGFGEVYKENWIDGYNIFDWDNENQNWNRYDPNILYGITQYPDTKNYMMVLDYAKNGSLRNYLDKSYDELNWETKIRDLYWIVYGIDNIHEIGLIHRDLHIGNILHNKYMFMVIAPEILSEQIYTKVVDIYSFGIIIYETISGLSPYHDLFRCKSIKSTIANEVENILCQWVNEFKVKMNVKETEIEKQIKKTDEINDKIQTNVLSTNLSYETHSEAIYTSRLINFNNLPEPKKFR